MISNQTFTVTEFLFYGFPQLEEGSLLFFIPLLIIYIFIVIGNLTVFFAVRMDIHLHKPMYNFISIFSFLEIWYTTATIPKMLSNLISKQKTISMTGCLLQMYFFHSLGNSEGILLTTMAIDRIITVILRIPSVEGRQKAFSTCAAHLGVFLMFYGSVSLMYLRFSAKFPPILDTAIALMFAVLAPFFNPIIYSLRNKDIKIAIKKLLCIQKM
ncbi:PREDICTED: olfactory receptor 6K3-like [Galeopterus variegatus]|uniref:Olfactory receptor 6K3-like n=1 Tax=Galeopterus variegatus TaxID=482537 RepID=A0ABM0RUH9_GALVR|nr:PREDICTED: olfactory receptor 6K3-like [Galeopterus variegatus]